MKNGILAIIAVLTLSLMAPAVYAGHQGHLDGKGRHDEGSIFCKMSGIVCENRDKLGLSDEQMEKVEALKNATQKDLIKKKSEIDVTVIDLKAEMKRDKVDMEVVNKLIDKKYELKKEKAKLIAGASAKLKEILTDEQKKTLKTLCKPCSFDGKKKEHRRERTE